MDIPNSCTFISIKLKPTKNWKKAIVYDTVIEKIVCEIDNNNNHSYHIEEKYDNLSRKICLQINQKSITEPSNKILLYRYMIKIIGIDSKRTLFNRKPINYIEEYIENSEI